MRSRIRAVRMPLSPPSRGCAANSPPRGWHCKSRRNGGSDIVWSRQWRLRRTDSLRVRLLGGMLAVFALGLAASLASYRYQVNNIVKDVRGRTLEAQARELLAALHVGPDGRIELGLSENWQQVYADPSRQFSYTIFDQAHQPLARSRNLAAPLPYVAVT